MVSQLTFRSPAHTSITGNVATFIGAPHSFTGIESASGTVQTFTRGSTGSTGVSFVLDPRIDASTGKLTAVCVEQVTPSASTETIGP